MTDSDFPNPDYDWTDPDRVERLWESVKSGLADADDLMGHVLAAHNQGARADYEAAKLVALRPDGEA